MQIVQEPIVHSRGTGSAVVQTVGIANEGLKITILSARGLRDADFLPGAGKCDPYAIVEIEGKPETKLVTHTVTNTNNPVWNFEAVMPGYVLGDTIVISVFDKDPLKDDFLGRVVLVKEQFINGLAGDLKLDLAGKDTDAYISIQIEAPIIAGSL